MNIARVDDCQFCYRVMRINEDETEAWCFGLRNHPTDRPCDVVQWCRIPAGKSAVREYMFTIDEAASLVSGLAEVIRVATRHKRHRCRRKKCSEWSECSNGGGA